MDADRFHELTATDGARLHSAATRAGLAAAVPTCPGWTVRDLVEHTAEVYEHKIACIAAGGRRPEPWPPARPDRDPLDWFTDALTRLLATLRDTDPAGPSWTWLPADQTAGFWSRRMSHETAIHRVDAESALAELTPLDPELATDGIEEVLTQMLGGDWSDEPQPGSVGTIGLCARWHVTLAETEVVVTAGAGPADVDISGAPSDVDLWLWGRPTVDPLIISGGVEVAGRLRDRLALATQ